MRVALLEKPPSSSSSFIKKEEESENKTTNNNNEMNRETTRTQPRPPPEEGKALTVVRAHSSVGWGVFFAGKRARAKRQREKAFSVRYE